MAYEVRRLVHVAYMYVGAVREILFVRSLCYDCYCYYLESCWFCLVFCQCIGLCYALILL